LALLWEELLDGDWVKPESTIGHEKTLESEVQFEGQGHSLD